MADAPTAKPILMMDDLRERWGEVSEVVVLRHIAEDGLPFLPLRRKASGRRPIWLFRLKSHERWERDRERVLERKADAGPPSTAGRTVGIPGVWDEVDRLGRVARRRRG